MILYRKYQPGGLTAMQTNKDINLPEVPEITVGKFAKPKDVYGMYIHKVPGETAAAIERKATNAHTEFLPQFKNAYDRTDALWKRGNEYYAGDVMRNLNTGIQELPVTPSLFEGNREIPGTSKYYNTNTAEDMNKEEVDDYIFGKFYDNEGTTGNVTDYYRDLYNKKLPRARRLY